MARYIDLDKLLNGLEDELKDKNPNDIAYLVFKLFIGRLSEEPAADVVPKSEVDWNSIPVDVSEALKQRAVEKAKADVAREIFEEIEKLIFGYMSAVMPPNTRAINHVEFAELKKKYTGEET